MNSKIIFLKQISDDKLKISLNQANLINSKPNIDNPNKKLNTLYSEMLNKQEPNKNNKLKTMMIMLSQAPPKEPPTSIFDIRGKTSSKPKETVKVESRNPVVSSQGEVKAKSKLGSFL